MEHSNHCESLRSLFVVFPPHPPHSPSRPPSPRAPPGIPYGTVNLRHGVPVNETKVASLAGGGTLTLELGVLSALTGDAKYGRAAAKAAAAYFALRNRKTDLVGKHVHIDTGKWVEQSSGVGSNGDSYYEYLYKMSVLFGDERAWAMFQVRVRQVRLRLAAAVSCDCGCDCDCDCDYTCDCLLVPPLLLHILRLPLLWMSRGFGCGCVLVGCL